MTDWSVEIDLSSSKSEAVHVSGISITRKKLEQHLQQTSALCSYENKVYLALTTGEILSLTFTLNASAKQVQLSNEEFLVPTHTDDHGPMPNKRKYASMVPLVRSEPDDLRLILSGGHSLQGGTPFRDVWEFSLKERQWHCLWEDVRTENQASTVAPAPFCAHSSLMLDSDTLLVVGGWPSHNVRCPHVFWGFRISDQIWYPIDVNMTTRAAPIAEVRIPNQTTIDGSIQIVVGGGFGSDIRTTFVTLKKDCDTQRYTALDPVIGLQSDAEVRVAACQTFYNGLQITLGGLRPSKSAFCTILDILNDQFVYKGDPFADKGCSSPPVLTQNPTPFSHSLPAAVVHLKHSPAAGVIDCIPVALMLPGGIAFIRTSKLKQLVKQWLSERSNAKQPLDSICADPLANFFHIAPAPALSSILMFM